MTKISDLSFVGRAGYKLDYAISFFKLNILGYTCADFGSNIGGFVDCLLQHGASKVYSVETGYGVLAWKLRQDPRVEVHERTNAMNVQIPNPVDLVTIDVSWTKQKNILPNAIKHLKPSGIIITLVKTHYEAQPHQICRGQLRPELVAQVLEDTMSNIRSLGLSIVSQTKSPLVGQKSSNEEYLLLLKKQVNLRLH